MIREHLFDKRAPADPMFRWRGGEISRLEGLSDGVFAVTLTLLVVSTGVPGTFYELWLAIRDLPIFLVSFVLLMMAWQYHYQFFRRYGLEDGITATLNAAFLFLVLFYAYPLKFLWTFLWRIMLGESTSGMFRVPEGVDWGFVLSDQRDWMMYFYGFGILGVFGVLLLMTWHAYRCRGQLELDDLEVFLTEAAIRSHLITVGIAMCSILVLVFGGEPGWSGVTYFLMGPAQAANGVHAGRRAERIKQRLEEASRPPDDEPERGAGEPQ